MAFFLKYDVCFDSDVILSTVTYGGVLSGGCHVSYSFEMGNIVIYRKSNSGHFLVLFYRFK